MQLVAKALLDEQFNRLVTIRSGLKNRPTLALIWVGADEQTGLFVRQKQNMAKKLDCDFMLHHFPSADQKQLEIIVSQLNQKKEITGVIIQLPVPKLINADRLINLISPVKDVDNLGTGGQYQSPTVAGIIALLQHHKIIIKDAKTVIIGAGKLVGGPLAKTFTKNRWSHTVIDRGASKKTDLIRSHDILIAATGVKNLVTPAMVHKNMIVVDGSGVDVDVGKIEPLVKAVTPTKGAIGPLTVSWLFENLLMASRKTSDR